MNAFDASTLAWAERARQMGVPLQEEQIERFLRYRELLLEWNTHTNLTRITDPEEVLDKHFLDSFAPLAAKLIPQGASIIDVGSGAGLPGIALGIVRTDVRIMLLDSSLKRVTFLHSVLSALQLPHISAVHANAKEYAQKHRGQYDIAMARAVASLPQLCEWLLPFVHVHGKMIAYKTTADEFEAARGAYQRFGGGNPRSIPIRIPERDWKRCLLVIEKIPGKPYGKHI